MSPLGDGSQLLMSTWRGRRVLSLMGTMVHTYNSRLHETGKRILSLRLAFITGHVQRWPKLQKKTTVPSFCYLSLLTQDMATPDWSPTPSVNETAPAPWVLGLQDCNTMAASWALKIELNPKCMLASTLPADLQPQPEDLVSKKLFGKFVLSSLFQTTWKDHPTQVVASGQLRPHRSPASSQACFSPSQNTVLR